MTGHRIHWFLLLVLTGCGGEKTEFSNNRQTRSSTADERAERIENEAEARGLISLSFQAGERAEETLVFDPGLGLIEQELSLVQKDRTIEWFNQTERAKTELQFTQGYDGERLEESFPVIEAGKVDILIVVDNSDTMTSIQSQLATALPELLTHIKNLNWQVAVNTTSSPCLQSTQTGTRIISKALYEADPVAAEQVYAELIQVGNDGNNVEMGMYSAAHGLLGQCPQGDTPWRRDDATPVVLMVSDEKNCGSGENEGCAGAPYETADYVLDRVPNVRAYALLLLNIYEPLCPDLGGYDNFYPDHYLDLVGRTGGVYDSICQESYATIMQNISADVSEQVVKTFDLSFPPDEIIEIDIDGEVLTTGYELKGQTLYLRKTIPLSSNMLKATYYHSRVERRTTFELDGTPDKRTLEVYLNGTEVAKNRYQFKAGSPATVTFSAMPPDLAKIRVHYRQNTVLQDNFVFDQEAKKNTLKVKVNGQEQAFSIKATQYKVVLAPPPLDGARVEISYEKKGDRQLTYPIPDLDREKIEYVEAYDPKEKVQVPVFFDQGQINFSEEDVVFGRKLKLGIKITHTPEELDFNLPLQMEPLPGSVEIHTPEQPGICALAPLKGKTIQFQCEDDEFRSVNISYAYAKAYQHIFKLPSELKALSQLKVFVDGVATTDFAVDLDTKELELPKEALPLGAKIKVVILP